MITIIKLLLGGSPCTKWSVAQTNNRETKPKGEGWELFRNYVIAKERFQPDYFIYENNMSADVKIKRRIEKELHQKLQPINSALVSAQNRDRFYVHNIPDVELPQDKGIVLDDILEYGKDLTCGEKTYCLTRSYGGAIPDNTISRHQRNMVAVRIGDIGSIAQANRVYSSEGKGIALKANGGGAGAKTGLYAVPIKNVGELKTVKNSLYNLFGKYGYIPDKFNAYNQIEIVDKSPTLTTGSMATSSCATLLFEKCDVPIYEVKNKTITINGKEYPTRLNDGYYIIRKLTVLECKRLQTVPDDYIMPCSTTQNLKMLGNGWTVDVICCLLSHIPNILNEEVLVLSMYDGMSCGQIALNKLGVNVVKYFATEIDKYCIETTQANFPNTIQLGNAMYVRSNLWWLKFNELAFQDGSEADLEVKR